MKIYHKPEIELNQFDMADVLDISMDTSFYAGDDGASGWFTDTNGGGI